MNKSVLVAALSVALISTGLADPDRGSSKGFSRGHRNAESGNSKGRATVVGANINVRSSPDPNSSLVTKVTGGNALILAQKGDWYKLKFQYGTTGWVRQDFLKISGHSAAKMIPIKLDPTPIVVSNSSKESTSKPANNSGDGLTRYASLVDKTVRIHKGPSASNSVVGKVKGGKALIVDKWDGWYKVKFQFGTTGWVKAESVVFPSNFDFKNSKNKPVVRAVPETVVATRTAPKIKKPDNSSTSGSIPENSVSVSGIGENITVSSEGTNETRNTSAPTPILATVIGDGISVRKGPSKSNSALTKVNGGQATIIDHRGDFYQLRFEHGTVGWVHESYVSFPGHIVKEAPKVPVASGDPDRASRLIESARTFTGVRYSWGSSSRSATDCSGFTLQVFRSVGIDLPRVARAQAQVGKRVGRDDLQKGDLVFFNTMGYISHVGIYIGNSRFIHASSGKHRVTESSLNEAYYGKVFLFGTRILPPSKVKKLDLPSPGELPNTRNDGQQDQNDDKVEISKGSSKDQPGSGKD